MFLIVWNKYTMAFLVLLSWGVAIYGVVNAVDFYRQKNLPIIEGTIVGKEEISSKFRLKIRIADGSVVNAIVYQSFVENLTSQTCQIFYDGVNKSDVLVEGEENPLLGAGLVFLLGFLPLLLHYKILPALDRWENRRGISSLQNQSPT